MRKTQVQIEHLKAPKKTKIKKDKYDIKIPYVHLPILVVQFLRSVELEI